MSLDTYFIFMLVVRMAVTAAFLIAATLTAERAGPLIGGLVATLPISAGPIYIFLSIDHDAHFVAQSALGSLVTNALNAVFALVYVLLAQRRSLAVCIGAAFAVWSALEWLIGQVSWTIWSAIAFNISIFAICLWFSAPLRHVRAPRVETRWVDIALRAAMVAVLVGTVVTLSFAIGPVRSGNLAVFPIVLTSIMLILHNRVGGKATAAVLANAIIGLVGFGVATLVLAVTAEALGSPLALLLALAVSVGGNILIFLARRRAVPTYD